MYANSLNGFMERLYGAGGGAGAPTHFGGFVLAASPDRAEIVLRNPDVFEKSFGLLEVLLRSRLTADGSDWAVRRALTQPQLNAAALGDGRNRIRTIFQDELDAIGVNKAIRGPVLVDRVVQGLTRAGMRIFLAAFDACHDSTPLLTELDDLRSVIAALQTASLIHGSSSELTDLRALVAQVHRQLRQYAADRPPLERLLERFASELEDDRDSALSELLGNLVAGVESTALVLSWSILMLGEFPDLQERLRVEAQTVGDQPGCEVFLNEVLRLFPPFPFVVRRAAEDFTSSSLTARKGDDVLVSIVGVQQDPEYWPEPRRFDPERAAFRERSFHRRAFIPFLYGQRVCGGAAFARLELAEGFAALLRRFRFTRLSRSIQFHYAAALRPHLAGALLVESL